MNKISFLIVSLIASVFSAELEDGVLVLTDDNFDEEIAKNPNLLVEFYAPWCGHCKKLAPKYASAASQLASLDPPQYIAKVDCTTNPNLKAKYEIKGFPTLKFFKNGEPHDYKGQREAKGIYEYVVKQTMPASLPIQCKQLEKRMTVENAIMVYFGSVDEPLYKDAHLPFASTHPKIKFFTVNDTECAEKFSAKMPSILFKYKNFEDGKKLSYEGAATKEALDAWVAPMMIPKYFEWHEDENDNVFKKGQLTIVLFRDEADKDESYVKTFADAAKANEGKALFSWNTMKKGAQEKGAKILGANQSEFP